MGDQWTEVGSNGRRCPECSEVVHEDNTSRHLQSEHTETWAVILDE